MKRVGPLSFELSYTAGRPAKPTRFMVSRQILKAIYDFTVGSSVPALVMCFLLSVFTDEAYFKHGVLHECSGLSHWRNWLGVNFLDSILCESLTAAQDLGALSKRDMEVVTSDTSAYEMSVILPTDAALLYMGLIKLGIEVLCPASSFAILLSGQLNGRRSSLGDIFMIIRPRLRSLYGRRASSGASPADPPSSCPAEAHPSSSPAARWFIERGVGIGGGEDGVTGLLP